MCLYPKLIPNPKYQKNKKNGGRVPKLKDERVRYIPAKCGQCIECRQQLTREWLFRIEAEQKYNPIKGVCVTLSFSEEALDKLPEEANESAARAVRLFQKRWDKKYKKAPRHWLKPELGHKGTERLHIHGFMWVEHPEDIENLWGYGNVVIEPIGQDAINYATKYINKPDKEHDGFIGKIMASKGIGYSWLKTQTAERYKREGENAPSYIRLNDGRKINIPTYLRRKLYDDETREKIWIKLLDKQVRYVRGIPIKAVDETLEGYREYLEALQHAQAENVKLGYPKRPWDEKKYMKTRKKMNENLEN